MQILVGDFTMPCTCAKEGKATGCRLQVVTCREPRMCQIGVVCPVCNAQVHFDLDKIDIFYAWGVDLRNGLAASGLTWPPREEK